MRLISSVVVTAALLFSVTAFSGQSALIPVTIDWDNRVASGNMLGARSTANDVEHIGCGRIVSDFNFGTAERPLYNYGFCQAVNAEDEIVICLTEDPEMLEVLTTISSHSFIRFGFYEEELYPGNYECSFLYVSSQSRYIPIPLQEKEKAK